MNENNNTTLYSQLEYDHGYKLIQLTPELLDALKSNNNALKFKQVQTDHEGTMVDDVILCSKNKSWNIKQKNHSNTVLLCKDEKLNGNDNCIKGYGKCTYEYETRLTKGHINLNVIPIYDGEEEEKLDSCNFEELINQSGCSMEEGIKEWEEICGCVIDNHVCILGENYIHSVLHILLMSLMAEGYDMESQGFLIAEGIESVQKDGNENEKSQVIESVIKRFFHRENTDTNGKEVRWLIDKKKIGVWYGIKALKKYASKNPIRDVEFLQEWRSMFPPFMSIEIDLKMLRGHYCKPNSIQGQIKYLSKDILPMDSKQRFKMLFQIQSQWLQEEIEPFVKDLNTRNMKIDTFIMKFARRRHVGKQYIIQSR
ncbi:hypothetical protein TBLA_0C01270 [Henningerozyma blattae CBS 6284]|uniref:Sister chromatid cohesion protein DCC1 n=1 Tax=Henningerozyma blattae (strain ATCC 34711 / CBS 6284 / DSM 70876 / NBRC 10599 / NRRL Y-10934 / UCD 77-7) TaxID=1071380 RepID=I2H0P0_HENB6|nr:hypothetical protein TBLA_0C01270 [Tetrapisispora blattae CBS 6284]CCH59942.1 hypothetical protein TBLA_0C01270 [Tetrapisispora blattae CBS 6284]